MTCRYCLGRHVPGDGHYAVCHVVRMCFDKKYHPLSESRARNARKRLGRATGQSGDGIGWRKKFTRKRKAQK